MTKYAIETYNLYSDIEEGITYESDHKKHAYKLRQLRKQKGLTIYELSKRSGISASYLSEIENGEKFDQVSWHTADKIASVLGVPLEEIFPQFAERKSPLPKSSTETGQ